MNVFYVLVSLLGILLIIILGYLIYKNKISRAKYNWQPYITDLINNALFDVQAEEPISKIMNSFISKNRFRTYLIDQIIQTKRSLAGDAGGKLKILYESLDLRLDSANKLKSIRWHIKAKGIQELSIMEQTGYVKKIFRLTNNGSEFVRNEAQCGLVNFYGFRGLRFLNVMAHPLSQWQQIQLLAKLNGTIPEDFSVIQKWLKSDNESVIIFSLKLAAYYNSMEVYEDVVNCLRMPQYEIKIQAINYLRTMPTETAGEIILEDYHLQSKKIKLHILEALQEVGNANHVSFLIQQLHEDDEEIIKDILATILVLNPLGSFQSSFINRDTQKALVHHFNSEHAA